MEGYGKNITLFQCIKSHSMASHIHIVLEKTQWLKCIWLWGHKNSRVVMMGGDYFDSLPLLLIFFSIFPSYHKNFELHPINTSYIQ